MERGPTPCLIDGARNVTMPPLAFGDTGARVTDDNRDALRALERDRAVRLRIRSLSRGDWALMACDRHIGSIGLLATASANTVMDVEHGAPFQIIVPLIGSFELQFGQSRLAAVAGETAILRSNVVRTHSTAQSSRVGVSFDPCLLARTRAIMAGPDAVIAPLGHSASAISFAHRPALFATVQRLCGMVDVMRDDGAMALTLGLEDTLYRWIATCLAADDAADASRAYVPRQTPLDDLCDAIRASYDRPMTLTEMEAATGLSARGLQYAFQRRFGCSPTQWQRRERLTMARDQLAMAGPEVSITDLAHAMGFASSAAFAAQYKRRFGETPSQTRRKKP